MTAPSPCGYCQHPLPDSPIPHACPNCQRVVLGIRFGASTTLGEIGAAMLRGGEDTRMMTFCVMTVIPTDGRADPPTALFFRLDEDKRVDGTGITVATVGVDAPAVCRPGTCPACGGEPDGEWFEGSEVKCGDCGVILVAAVVTPCFGSTTFVLAEVDHG